MSSYLIKFTHEREWDTESELDWLPEGEIQSGPLTDLRTSDGELSVWEIDDEKSNLDLVILGLACKANSFKRFSFGLFDPAILQLLEIPVVETEGNTAAPRASKYHRDLIYLTTNKLVEFVHNIFFTIQKERRVKPAVKNLILASWTEEINPDQANGQLKEKVESELNS